MSLKLEAGSQRWSLACDRVGCDANIIASSGEPEVQLKSLEIFAEALHWRRMTDAGDYCDVHAVDAPLPPVIPREQLCRKTTWCLLAHGHDGKCREVPRGKYAAPDLGPAPGEVGWSMSKRRRS